DSDLLHGWGIRPSDWSFGVSVQQQLFPRASVEVGYYRRTFTQYFTGGTVTDNLAISTSNMRTSRVAVPTDRRLPNAGRALANLASLAGELRDPAHRRAPQRGVPGQAERWHRPARLAGGQLYADRRGSGGRAGANRPSADDDRCADSQSDLAGRPVW